MPLRPAVVRRLCPVLGLLLLPGFSAFAGGGPDQPRPVSLARLPLNFEPNRGQAPPETRFTARNGNMSLGLRSNGADLHLNRPNGETSSLYVDFKNGYPRARMEASDQKASESNYLIGSDPALWHTHVPNFGRITYSSMYPGIDLVFYGNGQRLEYDFIVNPGADIRAIRMLLRGDDSAAMQPDGSVKIVVGGREIFFDPPQVYQNTPGGREARRGKFVLLAKNEIGFQIGAYDASEPLVIDPILTFSTFLAALPAAPAAVAADTFGNTYLAGSTLNGSYPITSGAYQPSCNSCALSSPNPDVFVTKLNASGSAQVYSTFLGGSNDDEAYGIAVDANGNAVVAGTTTSSDFPTKNPIALGYVGSGSYYGFVTSLSADGASLNYSSLLGGAAQQFGFSTTFVNAVTLDGSGSAFLTGTTTSPVFPLTAGAINNPLQAYPNNVSVYLMKLSSSGSLLISALLGNPSGGGAASGFTGASSIALDGSGNIFVAGRATPSWPTTIGAYQAQPPTVPSGNPAAPFVTKISPDGSTLLYSTFISQGGAGNFGVSLAVNANGNSFIAGDAETPFPTTANAYEPSLAGTGILACCPSFFSEIDPSGSQLLYSTFFGVNSTSSTTLIKSIRLDASGNIWLAGYTTDLNFPVQHPLQPVFGAGSSNFSSGFLSEFDPTGTNLLFSTFLGGVAQSTKIAGFAFDPAGKIHLAGTTGSDFSVTPGSFLASVTPPPVNSNYAYGFAAVVDPSASAPAACLAYPQEIGLFFPSVRVGASFSQNVTITNCGSQPLNISNIQASPSTYSVPAASNNCQQPVAVNASCTFAVTFTPTVAGTLAGAVTVLGNLSIPVTLPLSGTGTVPVVRIGTPGYYDSLFVGQSETRLVVVGNGGGAPLSVNLAQSSVTAGFSIGASPSCASPVAPNSSCGLFVSFSPSMAGVVTGTLSLATNDPVTPVAMVPLVGYGYTSYPEPEISYINPPTLVMGSPSTRLTVAGANFFPTSVINVNGTPVATTYANSFSLSATLDSSFVTSPGELAITVTNPAPGGQSTATLLTIYQSVSLGASSIIYEPVGKLLWAALPAAAATNPNTVVSINPSTGVLGTPIPVGNDPRELAVSGDGQYLYVSSNGTPEIQRINLSTLAIERTFSMPTDASNNALVANEMHVVPGSPQSVVTTLGPATGGTGSGLALFSDSGLVNWIANSFQTGYFTMTSFAFAGNPPVIYGLPFNSVGPLFFTIVTLDSGGLEYTRPTSGSSGQLSPPAFRVVSDGTLLYLDNGQVWSPVTQALVSTYASAEPTAESNSVVPNDSLGRTFFLDWAYTYAQTSAVAVHANDQTTLAVDGVVPFLESAVGQLPNIGFGIFSQWGSDGFAFLTFSGFTSTVSNSLILFQSSIASATPVSQPPYLGAATPAGILAGNPSFTIQASGANFVNGATINWNGTALPTTFVSSNELTATVPASFVAVPGFSAVTVTDSLGASSASLFETIPITQTKLAPALLSFGSQTVNVASAAQNVTLTNSGQSPLTISSISAGGSFTQTNNCGASLAVSASCTISVIFTPSAAGAFQGTLTVSDNGTTAPSSVALSGTGVAVPQATLAPASLSFGSQTVNVASAAQNVTLTNSGQSPLTISSISAGGSFTQTNNCGASLAVSASCAISVIFTPAAAGALQGTLTVSDNGTTAPSSVVLSGTGVLPDFSIATAPSGSTTATVQPGQSAVYSLSLAGGPGYTGTISLTCTQVPASYSCAPSPATLRLQPGASSSFTVTISPTASSALRFLGYPRIPSVAGLLCVLCVTCVLLAWRRSRAFSADPSWMLRCAAMALLAAVPAGIAGCGGGASSGPGSATTPQSYVVQIVASDGTTTHNLPITLTVQ